MNLPAGVFEYNNFIDEEDRKLLLEYVKFSDKWPNKNKIDFWEDKRLEIVDGVAEKILLKIRKKLIDLLKEEKLISNTPVIHRMYSGVGMGEHTDNQDIEENIYGFVYYINDDFNGGELVYTEYDYVYKPKAGTLIMHPCSIKHMVKDVLDGPTRYTVLAFGKTKDY